MNDPTEMEYGWDVLKQCLRDYEISNCVAETNRLSNFMENIEKPALYGVFYLHFYHEEKTPFVISFSQRKDFLPMWSMYGGNGSGVCLCFDDKAINIKNEKAAIFPILNALYVNQIENGKRTLAVLQECIDKQYQIYLKNDKTLNDGEKIITLGALIPFVSAYIKDSAFDYEQEERLVALANDIHKSVQFRISNRNNIIPYVEVPIPTNSMKEIIIGPNIKPECVESGLQLALHTCGLNVPISLSKIPYRES
ncbi:MAG: DUF2971 domain-containing protein [Bacteroidaceae bacterium]|nr:DUF2971 domain-containing protein [Bacteroidaceae bacterium]